MKHKVSELEGALLDAAVALAEGYTLQFRVGYQGGEDETPEQRTHRALLDEIGADSVGVYWINPATKKFFLQDEWERGFAPSSDWRYGGPIIERERIEIRFNEDGGCTAVVRGCGGRFGSVLQDAGAPLVAAMRAFVSSHFESEIDLD